VTDAVFVTVFVAVVFVTVLVTVSVVVLVADCAHPELVASNIATVR